MDNMYYVTMKHPFGTFFDIVGEDGLYYADSPLEAIENAMIETGIQSGTFKASNTDGSGEGDGIEFEVAYIGDGDFAVVLNHI